MYRDSTVGVVVPAYNEEGLVGGVIETMPEYVDRVYVVDDDSTDGTWAEIREHAAAANEAIASAAGFDERVVPIQHEENRGVGGGIKTGYLRALADDIDVTAVMGGDGQMDPAVLPAILDPVVDGEADYAKGNRFMRSADLDSMPRFRLFGNALLSFLTKVASGYWTISDPQNGYTAISSDALREASIEEMYEYYGYCNDLLIRLNAANCTVADVPHSALYDEEESHISYSEYIPRVSGMLLDGFVWRLNHKYLVREFHPLAIAYYAGASTVGVGAAGVLNALRKRRDSGGWVATAVLGVVLIVAAMAMDRAENRDREVRATDATIEPGANHEWSSTTGAADAADAADQLAAGSTARAGTSTNVGENGRSTANAPRVDPVANGEGPPNGPIITANRTNGTNGAAGENGAGNAADVEGDAADVEGDAADVEGDAADIEADGIDRSEGDVSRGDSFDVVGDAD